MSIINEISKYADKGAKVLDNIFYTICDACDCHVFANNDMETFTDFDWCNAVRIALDMLEDIDEMGDAYFGYIIAYSVSEGMSFEEILDAGKVSFIASWMQVIYYYGELS